MKRQIKFRGKRKGSGEWVFGYYIVANKKHCIYADRITTVITGFASKTHTEQVRAEVIPETVGQFTGLYDKYGTEIYEGDIFRTSIGFVAVVEWVHDGRFLGFTSKRELIYIDREPLVIVVGNIHDNPDLLTTK
jgi:uncharacterized phage protein (TIGR01671 family)